MLAGLAVAALLAGCGVTTEDATTTTSTTRSSTTTSTTESTTTSTSTTTTTTTTTTLPTTTRPRLPEVKQLPAPAPPYTRETATPVIDWVRADQNRSSLVFDQFVGFVNDTLDKVRAGRGATGCQEQRGAFPPDREQAVIGAINTIPDPYLRGVLQAMHFNLFLYIAECAQGHEVEANFVALTIPRTISAFNDRTDQLKAFV